MIYPDSFERKIGFDTVRREIDSRCLSPMGVRAASEISFSTDAAAIAEALEATSEMLSIVEGEEDLPFGTLADFEALADRYVCPALSLPPRSCIVLVQASPLLRPSTHFLSVTAILIQASRPIPALI